MTTIPNKFGLTFVQHAFTKIVKALVPHFFAIEGACELQLWPTMIFRETCNRWTDDVNKKCHIFLMSQLANGKNYFYFKSIRGIQMEIWLSFSYSICTATQRIELLSRSTSFEEFLICFFSDLVDVLLESRDKFIFVSIRLWMEFCCAKRFCHLIQMFSSILFTQILNFFVNDCS